jgi:UDP-2-acetamido-2,6-beta-L-arabino-hexul-4-ose reductase
VYIDDVTDVIMRLVTGEVAEQGIVPVGPVYESTVGEVAAEIRGFAESRTTLSVARVGSGFIRALYATYVSFLPANGFSYGLTRNEDARGTFAEVLRTPDAGQFSFFTAHPGVTRGGHYHHTKTEKFLVVQGSARFRFRHVVTGERHDLTVGGAEARIVETAPGWAHDITNVGEEELIVLLWANEVFDPQKPDTIMAMVAE